MKTKTAIVQKAEAAIVLLPEAKSQVAVNLPLQVEDRENLPRAVVANNLVSNLN